MYPNYPWLNMPYVAEAITAELPLNTKPWLWFYVQTTLLLKPSRARDRAAQTIS